MRLRLNAPTEIKTCLDIGKRRSMADQIYIINEDLNTKETLVLQTIIRLLSILNADGEYPANHTARDVTVAEGIDIYNQHKETFEAFDNFKYVKKEAADISSKNNIFKKQSDCLTAFVLFYEKYKDDPIIKSLILEAYNTLLKGNTTSPKLSSWNCNALVYLRDVFAPKWAKIKKEQSTTRIIEPYVHTFYCLSCFIKNKNASKTFNFKTYLKHI